MYYLFEKKSFFYWKILLSDLKKKQKTTELNFLGRVKIGFPVILMKNL